MKKILKNPWLLIGVVTVVLFGGAFYLAGQADDANNVGIETVVQVKGNPEATVVLEEFSDFQCPACQAAYPFISELVAQFSEDLRFEYKHFPIERIHPYALQAAMAAEAAGQQGKFFEFHDLLFENQQQWSGSPTPNIFFMQYAEQLDLDMDQFRRQANASVLRDKVRAEFTEGQQRGVTGTPGFFLNGERLVAANGGNLSYDDIAARIATAVAAANGTATSTPAAPQNENPDVVGEEQGQTVRFGI